MSSSWREIGRLYVHYLAAGIAAIPAGVIYALVLSGGEPMPWLVLLCLVIGLVSAAVGWKLADSWLDRSVAHPIFHPSARG